MKRFRISGRRVFALILALILLMGGVSLFGFVVFQQRVSGVSPEQGNVCRPKLGAFYLAVSGAMSATGIGMLILVPFYELRITQYLQREEAGKKERMRQSLSLAHRQRLETIGVMTSSIAHEFNNLLTPIMSYSMMVLEKLPPEEEETYDEVLEIYNASRKAKLLISRLSDLSRKNTENSFRDVSVDEVVRKTLDIANPARPQEVQVKLDLNCWDQRLRANELQLNQLLLNMILNSFHAMEGKGGILTLATAFDETQIHISVEDTGCGMEKEVVSRIFDPFFTTKEAGKGTGLGLAIAAQVVEDHQGTIHVESQKGKGTCFRVSLPRMTNSHHDA